MFECELAAGQKKKKKIKKKKKAVHKKGHKKSVKNKTKPKDGPLYYSQTPPSLLQGPVSPTDNDFLNDTECDLSDVYPSPPEDLVARNLTKKQ